MDVQADSYLLKSGDTAAFERIFRTYSRSMFFVAMGLVDDRQVAEDAVQESFVYLWNHRDQVDPAYDPVIAQHVAGRFQHLLCL